MRVKPSHTEGSKSTGWILLDYFDFVVHVFSAETRAFYGLERLWGSADSIDLTALVEPATARPGVAPLVARSAVMRALAAEVARYAQADANVLITGETGVGKDLVARTLHHLSDRRQHPFVVVDCPGLVPTLVESELFGHERGAFTDATLARPGRFEMAGEGIVYLDRVDELPLDGQAKLLRLVEHKQVERLGSSVVVPIRARVVASASRDIEQAVREGNFRMDPLSPPPRACRCACRPCAIGQAISPSSRAASSLRSPGLRTGRRPALSDDALAALASYDWPGNARELRHVLEHAMMAARPRDDHRRRPAADARVTRADRGRYWRRTPDARGPRAPIHHLRPARDQRQPDARRQGARHQPQGALGKAQAVSD
jgi:anaerobic nitric oxide reductase transcription regulator